MRTCLPYGEDIQDRPGEPAAARAPGGARERNPGRGGPGVLCLAVRRRNDIQGEVGKAMPRWRELSEELDPEIREFAGQLRRLVDRSGLSVASLSDRTGYSRTSWERYLNGRLLAPKGAIIALAEVTHTSPVHLTTMWELAERAWSRSEMRHDMTMEAIRISQARAALGETAPQKPGGREAGPQKQGGRGARRQSGSAARSGASSGSRGSEAPESERLPGSEGPYPEDLAAEPPAGSGAGERPGRRAGRASRAETAVHPGVATGPGHPNSGHPSGSPYGGPGGPATASGPREARPAPRSRRRSPLLMVLAGVVVVAVAAVLTMRLAGGNAEAGNEPAPPPSTTAAASPLPEGVECVGKDCAGRDPEEMGCAGEYVETSDRATVGTAVVEIRWSKTCGAAWARITSAAAGDGVRISSTSGGKQNATVGTTTDAYTPMVAARKAADVTACGILATGTEGCTK